MKLRTRLNLVVTGLTAAFVIVLILAEFQATKSSIREESEAIKMSYYTYPHLRALFLMAELEPVA